MLNPTDFKPRSSMPIEPADNGGARVIGWLASHLATAAIAGLFVFLVLR